MTHDQVQLAPRKFGYIFLAYFSLIIVLFMWRDHPISHIVWLVFGLCVLSVLFAPRCLAPIQFLWDRALGVLRYINTRLLLGFLFFGIFTPIALCKKLLRKDALGLRYDASCKTYRTTTVDIQNDLARPY